MPRRDTIPTQILPFLSFLGLHVPVWAGHAAELGLDPETIASLEAAAADAAETELAKQRALEQYRGAVMVAEVAAEKARAIASAAVATIRATAARTGSVEVLTTARLDPTAAGGPLPAPGRPYQFEATLRTTGELALAWKCRNPANAKGTVYEVRRSCRDAEGREISCELLGTAGARRFIDRTVPAGAAVVTYQITGVRGQRRGEPQSFSVNLGVVTPVNEVGEMNRAA